MAYSQELEERIDALTDSTGLVKKSMFGGIAYLLNGNMSLGIHKDNLVVRCSVEQAEELLKDDGVGLMDITGRPMKGWLLIEESVLELDKALQRYLDEGLKFAQNLPPK